MIKKIVISKLLIFTIIFSTITYSSAQEEETNEIIEKLKKDIKTLEKAVYSQSNESNFSTSKTLTSNDEDVLTRHLLKLSEIEQQFQELTNKFEEINFKIDRLSTRLSKVQADNQLRFQELEIGAETNKVTSTKKKKTLPGSSEPQDLGAISYKDTETKELVQKTQSVETTGTIVTETFVSEEKILPKGSPKEQYNFATSLLKQGDYSTAERALREFVIENPEDKMAGNAQYWYAETFRIRQLYTDAASAYLEGYQKYPKSEKAAINLLKLGVSLVQIGEKDQGCLMIVGVKKEYPKAKQSVLQKAQYEEKKFDCKNKIHKNLLKHLNKRNYKNIYSKFEIFLNENKVNSFVVAVSGGVDSLALVFLAKCYQLKKAQKFFLFI